MGAAKKHAHDWQAWVNLKWKSGAPDEAWQKWKKNKLVKAVWTTNGDWDCTIWVDVSNPADLERFVWKEVRANQWVESTSTWWAKQWW